MPKAEVRSTTWKRVGVETQEAEGHRVHAQKDLVSDAWRFVAVRKGDGINPCKPLDTHDTAAQARAQCEADVYEFHWGDPDRSVERAALNLQSREQLELHIQQKEERKITRKARKNDRQLAERAKGWKQ